MIIPIVRILFGALFMASAILKLFPIDYFELILVQQVGISWFIVPYVSRALILFELALGLSIALGFKTKLALKASLGLLVFFTIYLLYQVLTGSGEQDCGCFGELIPMDGPTSIAKNIVFMLMAIGLLLRPESELRKWTISWLGAVLSIIAIPILLIAVPVPVIEEGEDFELDTALFESHTFPMDLELSEGKNLVIVLYAECIHCARLASKLAQLNPDQVNDQLGIIIMGKVERVEQFAHMSGIDSLNFVRSEDRAVIAAIKGTFPTAALVEDGVVTQKWSGNDLNVVLIHQLLGL